MLLAFAAADSVRSIRRARWRRRRLLYSQVVGSHDLKRPLPYQHTDVHARTKCCTRHKVVGLSHLCRKLVDRNTGVVRFGCSFGSRRWRLSCRARKTWRQERYLLQIDKPELVGDCICRDSLRRVP